MAMDCIESKEDFKAAIAAYIRQRGYRGPADLAKELARLPATVEDWLYRGPRSRQGRAKIVERYPAIFGRLGLGGTEGAPFIPEDSPPESPAADKSRALTLAVRVELARMNVVSVSSLLAWFVQEASEEERHSFRAALGEEWQRFIDLTRAMVGEKALEMARSEGRLAWLK